MTIEQDRIIERHRRCIQELREEAPNLAASVADAAWDDFEDEINNTVGNEYISDNAEITKLALSVHIAEAYDKAFEYHVTGYFDRLARELSAHMPDAERFDSSRAGLTAMRKGIKLRGAADRIIGAAIERAEPGVGSRLGVLFSELFHDPDEQMDAFDAALRRHASCVKQSIMASREEFMSIMRDETVTLVHEFRRAYANWLDALPVAE